MKVNTTTIKQQSNNQCHNCGQHFKPKSDKPWHIRFCTTNCAAEKYGI